VGVFLTLLLDTAAFIYLVSEPPKLSREARRVLDDRGADIGLSHVSIWEVHLKNRAGKLSIEGSLRLWFTEQIKIWNIKLLPIRLEHLYRTAEIQDFHDDPFDRLLIGQALSENLPIVTPDQMIRKYPVNVIW